MTLKLIIADDDQGLLRTTETPSEYLKLRRSYLSEIKSLAIDVNSLSGGARKLYNKLLSNQLEG